MLRNKGEALKRIYKFFDNSPKKLLKAIKEKTIESIQMATNNRDLKLINEVIKDLELNLIKKRRK